ncbi:MAG: HTH domain-containing protein [Candidatus Puniceispirillaceae bacterium]
MTTNNEHINELCNQLVAAVRADVKAKLYERFKAEFDFQTGMHGEPLQPVRRRGERGADKRPFRPNSSLAKLYRVLASRKTGVNIQTLARETGLTKKAVHMAVYKLRKHGYKIVVKREGFQRPKYKLAS